MELTKIIRASDMKKKRTSKEPYEGYTLPASSEKGGQFVDWNEVLQESLGIKPMMTEKIRKKIIKIKKRKKEI